MRRAEVAYLAGMAVAGCVVEGVKLHLVNWLRSLGIPVDKGRAELPRRYCRYSPQTLLEHVYFVKGAFETHGEFFIGDPHGGGVVIIFKTGAKKLVKSLRLMGLTPLETTDESGSRRFIVLYKDRDIRRFVKIVKPVVEEAAVAKLLGLCTRNL
jgi:hypothetical protein